VNKRRDYTVTKLQGYIVTSLDRAFYFLTDYPVLVAETHRFTGLWKY